MKKDKAILIKEYLKKIKFANNELPSEQTHEKQKFM